MCGGYEASANVVGRVGGIASMNVGRVFCSGVVGSMVCFFIECDRYHYGCL